MTKRTTLPEQRAQETRQRIVEAASRVFTREGYGEAAVEDILAEADVSRGAFYHHFAGKVEVFRAVMDEHVHEEMEELQALGPAGSLRELLERYVAFQLGHMGATGLSLEFWAAAAREETFRAPVNAFHRRSLALSAEMLRLGQRHGAFRAGLDVEATAFLLTAIFEGAHVLLCLDPEVIDPRRLAEPWLDLVERFVVEDGEVDVAEYQKDLGVLLQRFHSEQTGPGPAP